MGIEGLEPDMVYWAGGRGGSRPCWDMWNGCQVRGAETREGGSEVVV
jgi:hypothetical protein